MSRLKTSIEIPFDTATDILVNLIVHDYNIVVKNNARLYDAGYHANLLLSMRTILDYYGGEESLNRLEVIAEQ